MKNNPRFRRDEVRALAASTYALHGLGRGKEVRARLDAAFARLAELKLHPTDRVEPGSEADDALRALADHEAAGGNVSRATEIYRKLLDQISAAKPRPEEKLADAAELSSLYASLAVLERRGGSGDRASELAARRAQLWQGWARKLGDNPFVLRQLAGAPTD